MAYVHYSKSKNEIFVYDDFHRQTATYKLGDCLFSFLELDFTEYDSIHSLHDLYLDDNELYRSCINKLCIRYPETAELMFQIYELDDESLEACFSLFLISNTEAFSSLYNHPYIHFSDAIGYKVDTPFDDIDFLGLQNDLKRLIDFCFLDSKNPKLNDLSPRERYFLFTSTNPSFYRYELNTHSTVLLWPIDCYEEIRNARILNSNSDTFSEDITDDVIKKIKGRAECIPINKCLTTRDFCFLELYLLLSNRIIVKRCANCGKLFIPSGKYSTDCCDRIPEGEKYSCKKIMAQKRRKQKVNSDPITKEYEKAYKRMYARIGSGTLKKSDFLKWSEEAKQKRDAASQRYAESKDETILIDFKKYLGNK